MSSERPSEGPRIPPEGLLGAVLAGGGSRRMGGIDKALLDLGDGPLLARSVALLRTLCANVVVSGDPALHSGFGAEVVADRIPGGGPLSGLHSALEEAGARDVLLVACDLPFVEHLLLARLARTDRRWDAAVFTRRGFDEPLCGRYAARIRAEATAALGSGRHKMMDLLDELRVLRIPVESLPGVSPESLFNLNTPEDMDAARRMAAGRRQDAAAGSDPGARRGG